MITYHKLQQYIIKYQRCLFNILSQGIELKIHNE